MRSILFSMATLLNRVTANSYATSSDRRLKTNITPYKPKNSILDMTVKSFTWKESGLRDIGFIAQEVIELFPEIVTEGEDTYLSLSENKIPYLLLLELQRMKKKFGFQKTAMTEFQKRLAGMEKGYRELKKGIRAQKRLGIQGEQNNEE